MSKFISFVQTNKIIVFVVLCIVGVSGYLYYESIQPSSVASTPTTSTSPTTPSSTNLITTTPSPSPSVQQPPPPPPPPPSPQPPSQTSKPKVIALDIPTTSTTPDNNQNTTTSSRGGSDSSSSYLESQQTPTSSLPPPVTTAPEAEAIPAPSSPTPPPPPPPPPMTQQEKLEQCVNDYDWETEGTLGSIIIAQMQALLQSYDSSSSERFAYSSTKDYINRPRYIHPNKFYIVGRRSRSTTKRHLPMFVALETIYELKF